MITDFLAALHRLSDDELHAIIAGAALILEERREAGEDPDPEPEPASGGGMSSNGARGWVEVKMVNSCGPYAYARWWEGKRKRSKYLGKVKTG